MWIAWQTIVDDFIIFLSKIISFETLFFNGLKNGGSLHLNSKDEQ
jgi:hypothetical protein